MTRRYFERLGRLLDEYWTDPVPIEEWDRLDEALADVHPDATWNPPTTQETKRGREEWVSYVKDWLGASDDWRVALEEASDLGDELALAVLRVTIRGAGSGVSVDQHLYPVITVKKGQITDITDYLDREQAIAAARAP